MSLTRTRTTALMSGAALGALLLAGCSNGDAEGESSPSTSPTLEAQQPPAAPGLPETDPDATGTSTVESIEGTVTAQVPNAWGQYPAEQVAQAAQDESITDVLGMWVAGDSPETQHSVAVMRQINEQPDLGAQEYFDANFANAEAQGFEISKEIFTSSTGNEVLYLTVDAQEEAQTPGEGLFVVFDEDEMVVGLMTAAGQLDEGLQEDLRELADSVEIA